jgi:hypothetical protein
MNNQQRLDLQDIRDAAYERNQQQLQFLLKRLLQSLNYYTALSVPLDSIRNFLEIFEDYYPEETWVRKLLLSINMYGLAPSEAVAEMALQQSFTIAGTGNFLKAVYDLTQAMQDKHTPEARIGFMASAVVNAIMAQLAEAWYGKRDKAWEGIRGSQHDLTTGEYVDEKASRIAYTFWIHPDTAKMDTETWLALADNIEGKLKRLESTKS